MNILKNKNCNIKINGEEIPIELYRKTNNEFVKYVRYDDYKKLENIIKEVREILKFHLSNPSGTKNGWHIDIWSTEDINKLNELLEILDKENK